MREGVNNRLKCLLLLKGKDESNEGWEWPPLSLALPVQFRSLLRPQGPSEPSKEDTCRVIHVWLSCVKKRVGAQELGHQRKHKGRMPAPQELQAPETNRNDISTLASVSSTFHTLQLQACHQSLRNSAGSSRNSVYRTEELKCRAV